MIFLRDLDMIHEKELLIESERFRSLYPDYAKMKHVKEADIPPDYISLRRLIRDKLYVSDDYTRENVNADFYIRWELLKIQDKKIMDIYDDIEEKKNEEIYPYYADYNYIDFIKSDMWKYLTRTIGHFPRFMGPMRPPYVHVLERKLLLVPNRLKEYVNEIIGYDKYELEILDDIIANDENFHNIQRHNSNDGQILPWPLYNTAEGQQYLAKKMKEIRTPKIISKAKELYDKSDDELEPIKYQLHYLKEEPLFKKLCENKTQSPNYVELLSERIEKYEKEHKEEDYNIDRILRLFFEERHKKQRKSCK